MVHSWLVAGLSIAGVSSANSADKRSAEIEKYQNLINVERTASDASLASYNATLEQGISESEQTANAAAMGKRSEGGSQGNIKKLGREVLAENIKRTDREVSRNRKFAAISNKAIDQTTKAKTTARTIGALSGGLMSFSKPFKDK